MKDKEYTEEAVKDIIDREHLDQLENKVVHESEVFISMTCAASTVVEYMIQVGKIPIRV